MKQFTNLEKHNDVTLYDLIEQFREIQHETHFKTRYETEIFRVNDDKYIHVRDDDVAYMNARDYHHTCYMSTFNDEFFRFMYNILKTDVSEMTYEQIDELVRAL